MEQKKKVILIVCLVVAVGGTCLLSCVFGGLFLNYRHGAVQDAREAEAEAYEEMFKAADEAQKSLDRLKQ